MSKSKKSAPKVHRRAPKVSKVAVCERCEQRSERDLIAALYHLREAIEDSTIAANKRHDDSMTAAEGRQREIMKFLRFDGRDQTGVLNDYVRNLVAAISSIASAAANPGG